MAKIDSGKMQIELNPQDRRIIRDLTKAIDRLSRNMMPFRVEGGVTRLMEPAEDLEPGERQLRTGQRNICGND